MKTKILKPLLAMACLLSSINASAYDFEVDGIYYDVVSLSEFTCKVVKGNSLYSGDIVIPAHVNYANKTLTVVEIEDLLFSESSELTGITIPNTITSISNNMFDDCKKLERVKFEDGKNVLKLGYQQKYYGGKGLFYYCPITSLYVGRNLSYESSYDYGHSPFYEIKTLKEVTIGNSVTEIGSSAFSCCSGLTSITIPNSVTRIAPSAFEFCQDLTSITIPNSVTEIDSCVFYYSGLTSITIPSSITKIGPSAFSHCHDLTSITIPNSVTEIDSRAFSYSGLASITIPNSVTRIAPSAFEFCQDLTSITIPNSVTEIDSCAFYYSGLTSITIPSSITKIGPYAFEFCQDLTGITIPNSVTSIGDWAFYGCSALTDVILPNSLKKISAGLFNECSNLTKINIPNSVRIVGRYAFQNSGLKSIIIPNSVGLIEEGAFAECCALDTVIIEDCEDVLIFDKLSWVDDDYWQFENSPIKILYLGRNVEYLTCSPFKGCKTMKELTLGKNVTAVGYLLFGSCQSIEKVYTLNPTPPELTNSAFAYYAYLMAVLNVPQGSLSKYKATNWKNFKDMKEGAPTGIDNVKNDIMDGNSKCYDLRGNRLSAPKRGLNIINGKKVIVK